MTILAHSPPPPRALTAARLAIGLAPLAALSLAACTFIGRASVLPTVDTRGDVGVEAKLTLGVGLTTEFDYRRAPPHTNTGLLSIPVSVGVGALARGLTQEVFTFESGLEYASIGSDAKALGFRVGLLGTEHIYSPHAYSSGGGTLESALLWTLAKRGDHRLALGPMLDASVLSEDRLLGHFGLGLTLDWYKLTEWTVR